MGNRRLSINEQRVLTAMEEHIKAGKRIVKTRIARENGYSRTSAKSMKPYKNKGFQQAEASLLERLAKERERVMLAMQAKNLSKEEYKTLLTALDVITKNHQLLRGESTDNVEFKIVE